jgi:hypothetical protein
MNRVKRGVWIGALAVIGWGGAPGISQAVQCQNNIPPSNPNAVYQNHGNGTVADTRTGLMWKQCSEGQSWSPGTCSGTPSRFTWSQALAQAEAATFAGYADWRVPNIKELSSLVEDCRVLPAINDVLFPNTPGWAFWSVSPSAQYWDDAWYVSFSYGQDYVNPRSNDFHVRLVRAGQWLGNQVIDDFETYAVGPLPSLNLTFENANIVWTSIPGLTPSGSISQSAQSGTKALRLEDFTVRGILKNLFVASATDVSVWMRITDLDWLVPYQFANFSVELRSGHWQQGWEESIHLYATVCKVGDVLAISNDNCLTHVGVFTENEWVKVVMHLDYESSRWRVRVNNSDWSQYLPFFYPRVRYLASINLDTFTWVYDGVVEFDNIQISIP